MSGVSLAVSTGDAYAIGFVTVVSLASLIGWYAWFEWRDRRKGITKAEVDPDTKLFGRIYRAVLLLGMLAFPIGIILLLPDKILGAVLLGLGWLILICALPYVLAALLARRKREG